jgi:hypothetical protein
MVIDHESLPAEFLKAVIDNHALVGWDHGVERPCAEIQLQLAAEALTVDKLVVLTVRQAGTIQAAYDCWQNALTCFQASMDLWNRLPFDDLLAGHRRLFERLIRSAEDRRHSAPSPQGIAHFITRIAAARVTVTMRSFDAGPHCARISLSCSVEGISSGSIDGALAGAAHCGLDPAGRRRPEEPAFAPFLIATVDPLAGFKVLVVSPGFIQDVFLGMLTADFSGQTGC